MFAVKLSYSDGTSEVVRQPRLIQAERIANRYQNKIGRTFRLFNRDFTADRFVKLIGVELQA